MSVHLTPRERTILVEAANGATLEETAHRLGLSVQTIKNARYKLMHRIGAANMPDTFRRIGWLEVPDR